MRKDTPYAWDPKMESELEDELAAPTRLPRLTLRHSIAGEAVAAASKETPYANVGILLMTRTWKKAEGMSRSSGSSQVSSRSQQHHQGALLALVLHRRAGVLPLLSHAHLVQGDHCGQPQASEALPPLHMQSERCSNGEQRPLRLVAIGEGAGACSERPREMR